VGVSGTRYGEELVRLASADNFRDVSDPDTAYAGTAGTAGLPLRRRVAYRSNELRLTDADVASLVRLGIGAIYDLRARHEVETHPDGELPGARGRHLEVRGIPMDAVSSLADPGHRARRDAAGLPCLRRGRRRPGRVRDFVP
jgi:protein-tyrosine phosphatase